MLTDTRLPRADVAPLGWSDHAVMRAGQRAPEWTLEELTRSAVRVPDELLRYVPRRYQGILVRQHESTYLWWSLDTGHPLVVVERPAVRLAGRRLGSTVRTIMEPHPGFTTLLVRSLGRST